MSQEGIDSHLVEIFKKQNCDYSLSSKFLDMVNSGKIFQKSSHEPSFPSSTDRRIFDLPSLKNFVISKALFETIKSDLPASCVKKWPQKNSLSADLVFSREELELIGLSLVPYMAFGILNGGSATSFIDTKKNKSLGQDLFAEYQSIFDDLGHQYKNQPKGLTPAFINPDGSTGPNYITLKIRSILILVKAYQQRWGKLPQNPALFQMTSGFTHDLMKSYESHLDQDPYLKKLIQETGFKPFFFTEIQSLLAAFTGDSEKEKDFFFYEDNGPKLLPLPGGHGQNFQVLKGIYHELNDKGYLLAYLGNVDNLGFFPDPLELALMILGNNPASFEFSYRTMMDIKGGVLVDLPEIGLTVRDLGVGISKEKVSKAEGEGSNIFFNCATGLFNLDYLINHLDDIIDELPLRLNYQDKDVGKYSHVEQITWEVMDLIPNAGVFAVNKYHRFLAAKLLMENLLTSGIHLQKSFWTDYPELAEIAKNLHSGLGRLLEGPMEMKKSKGKWQVKE